MKCGGDDNNVKQTVGRRPKVEIDVLNARVAPRLQALRRHGSQSTTKLKSEDLRAGAGKRDGEESRAATDLEDAGTWTDRGVGKHVVNKALRVWRSG